MNPWRPAWVWGGVLAVALAGAWVSWSAREPADEGEEASVTVLDLAPGSVTAVRYEAADLQAELTPREDPAGKYVWLTTHYQPPAKTAAQLKAEAEAKASEAGAAPSEEAAPPAEPPAPPPAQDAAFKGGRSAETLLEKLTPLRAKREVQAADGVALADLGLEVPAAKLVIVTAKGEHALSLGETVFGGDSRYVRDEGTGKIYLVDARALRPLATAHVSFVDRELFGILEAELESLVVTAGERMIALEHRNRADDKARHWAEVGKEGRSETVEAWVRRLLRMRAQDYRGDAELPDGREPAFTVVAKGTSGREVRVEVSRLAGSGDKERFFARSDFTRGTVEVYRTQAADTVRDVATLFDGAPAAATAPDSAAPSQGGAPAPEGP